MSETNLTRKIPLTQGKFAIVNDEDYDLASRFRWGLLSCKNSDYAHCNMYMGIVGNKQKYCGMLLHDLIMRPPKGKEVDHKNHNGLDCCKSNLRICNRSQNLANKRKFNGSSQYKGVYLCKQTNKWRAEIRVYGKRIRMGRFADETEAAHAYDRVAIKYFGEFACTNFPRKEYLKEIA